MWRGVKRADRLVAGRVSVIPYHGPEVVFPIGSSNPVARVMLGGGLFSAALHITSPPRRSLQRSRKERPKRATATQRRIPAWSARRKFFCRFRARVR